MILAVPFLTILCPMVQSKIETYGKSDSDILAMTGVDWVAFYTGKAGGSTMDYNDAWSYYADLAAKRNDREMAGLPPAKRKTIKRLDILLNEFSASMVDLGRASTGGGTIWSNVASEAVAEAEETIFYVLRPHGKIPVHLKVSSVSKNLTKIAEDLKSGPQDGVGVPSAAQVKTDLVAVKTTYTQIIRIASKLSRNASDRILGYCLDLTQGVLQNNS